MKSKYYLGLITLILVIGVGAGAWYGGMRYAHMQMKMGSGDMGDMSMGSESQSMAGMSDSEMAAMPGEDGAKAVPGYVPITVSRELQQQIGVRFEVVKLAPLEMSVSAVGIVRPDETKVADVYVKTEGWVNEVFVDFMGKQIDEGTPLLSVYSPAFVTAQQEYLVAQRNRSSEREAGIDSSLTESTLQKLELLDIPDEEIKALQERGSTTKYLTLRSPVTGTVLMKNVYAGEKIMPSSKLYQIADLSSVWVQAKVYEYQLTHIELGQPAFVQLSAFPGQRLEGKVVFIQPMLDEKTRTTDVRIELPNPNDELKIGMFADVEIMHMMGDGLLTPVSSVIRTGEREVVFRVGKDNQFTPVEVTISPIKFGDNFHVLTGLSAGDKVVSSANFMIDSESRLRAGGGASMPGMEGMDMGEETSKAGN